MKFLGRYIAVVSIVILTTTLMRLGDMLWSKTTTIYANDALEERLEAKSTRRRPPSVELPIFRVYPNSWQLGQGSIKAATDSTSSNPSLKVAALRQPSIMDNESKSAASATQRPTAGW